MENTVITTNEETPKKSDKSADFLPPDAAVFDWVRLFVFSVIIVIAVFNLAFRGVRVDGDSMNDTLTDGDYLIISDLFYTPKTGDIVILYSDRLEKTLVKRVIGTEGQTIKIDFENWKVWVDGVEMDDPFVKTDFTSFMRFEDMKPDANGIATVTVEKGKVFVMGDNRNDSLDSRSNEVGQIDKRMIYGKLLIRVFPFASFGTVD